MSSSEKNMIQLTHQVRENQTDLNDFLKDLNSWTGEIKKTDETLKKGNVIEESVSNKQISMECN